MHKLNVPLKLRSERPCFLKTILKSFTSRYMILLISQETEQGDVVLTHIFLKIN